MSNRNRKLKSLKQNNEPFFFQNMGLRIIFRLIKVMEYNKFKGNITVNNEKIIEDLKNIMIDSVYEEVKNSYGEGGANISADYLCKKLIDQYPERYNKVELDLKKIKYRKR